MSKFQIRGQIARLLALEWCNGFQIGGSVWVLLLATRGFSLAEIGLAEGFFHIISLCCEVPSGLLADILGRRKTLMASQVLFGLSALAMIFSHSLPGVCIALGLDALGYNLSSGTREALTYDSLTLHGCQDRYLQISSAQLIFYRLGAAMAMLCAGWAVSAGHRLCYALDGVGALVCFLLAAGLWEAAVTDQQRCRPRLSLAAIPRQMWEYLRTALDFLRRQPKAGLCMLASALIGSCATLLIFFLQDGLPAAGADTSQLGLLLVLLQLGSVAGAQAGLWLSRLPLRLLFPLCAAGVAAGTGLCATGSVLWLTLGGFCAGVFDEACNLVVDARLNDLFPSDQRATLVSVQSLTYSLVMIVLSPLGGLGAQVLFS